MRLETMRVSWEHPGRRQAGARLIGTGRRRMMVLRMCSDSQRAG